MLAKAAAALLALLMGGCILTVRDNVPTDNGQTAIIVAQSRRIQLIGQIEQLERVLRRPLTIEARAAIQSNINRLRFEIERLNLIITD